MPSVNGAEISHRELHNLFGTQWNRNVEKQHASARMEVYFPFGLLSHADLIAGPG